MLRKSYLVGAYGSLQQCSLCPPSGSCCASNTSPSNLPTKPQQQCSTKRRRVAAPSTWNSKRTYATVRGNGIDFRDNMNWPCRNGQATNTTGTNPFVPNPYEIFDMQRRESYGRTTKLKYYELVKIYHPDRAGMGCAELTHVERLERYRLIVLAHEILSDPDKRRAYDAYGAGWGSIRNTPSQARRGRNAAGQEYGHGPGFDSSPFGNATWEDWERWYRRSSTADQKQAYAGTFVNPNIFATSVIILAILSGVFQATSISQSVGTMQDKQLAFTEETSKFMTARASQFDDKNLGSEGRVKHFLEKRDPTRYGLKEEEGVQYRKVFGNGEDALPLGREKHGGKDAEHAPD